jgi:subtilase family serine protease
MRLKCLSAFGLAAALTAGLCGSASAAALMTAHVPAAVSRHSVALAGHVDGSTPMRMQVVLPMRDKEGLKALLAAQYNPESPLYRHWLSVAEFTKRFGPTQKDYDAAIAFFRAQGLSVTNTAPNRYLFQVEGRASDVERVLHVQLNLYKHPVENRNFMAPDREPTLALNVTVQHITGLSNFVLPHPKVMAPGTGHARSTAPTGSGPNGNFIGSDFRAAYYGTGTKAKLDGKGQSVGLMELEGYIPSDVPFYFTTVGQPLNVAVNGISVDGTPVDCGHCDDAEQVLDIDYAISMAPGMDQVQVYVGSDPVGIENRMASDNTSKQLSTSWGYDEDFADEDPLYQEMAAQGQSYFTASGDFSTLIDSGPWPEEDANIIAVGGTDLVTTGPGGAWQSEPGWEDSAAGPSVDKSILIESYQLPYINKKNLGSKTLRNVADISANADFDMYVCSRGKCSGGWAGTSFSSPMWAGFNAMVNQQALKKGKPEVGFLNPTLYALYKHNKAILHDVIGNMSGKFPAVKGYDLVGGLGSPNGAKTIRALIGK